jgi:hypothetical protein
MRKRFPHRFQPLIERGHSSLSPPTNPRPADSLGSLRRQGDPLSTISLRNPAQISLVRAPHSTRVEVDVLLTADLRQPVLVLLSHRDFRVTPETLDVALLRPALLSRHPSPLNPLDVVGRPRISADAFFREPSAGVPDAPDPVGPPLVDQLQQLSFTKVGHQLRCQLVPLPSRGRVSPALSLPLPTDDMGSQASTEQLGRG